MSPFVVPAVFKLAANKVAPGVHEGVSEDVGTGKVEQDVLEEGLPRVGKEGEPHVEWDEEGEGGEHVPAEVDEPVKGESEVSPGGIHVVPEMDAVRVDLITGGLSISVVDEIIGISRGESTEVHLSIVGEARSSGRKSKFLLDEGVKLLEVPKGRNVKVIFTKADSVGGRSHFETLSESLFVLSL